MAEELAPEKKKRVKRTVLDKQNKILRRYTVWELYVKGFTAFQITKGLMADPLQKALLSEDFSNAMIAVKKEIKDYQKSLQEEYLEKTIKEQFEIRRGEYFAFLEEIRRKAMNAGCNEFGQPDTGLLRLAVDISKDIAKGIGIQIIEKPINIKVGGTDININNETNILNDSRSISLSFRDMEEQKKKAILEQIESAYRIRGAQEMPQFPIAPMREDIIEGEIIRNDM